MTELQNSNLIYIALLHKNQTPKCKLKAYISTHKVYENLVQSVSHRKILLHREKEKNFIKIILQLFRKTR